MGRIKNNLPLAEVVAKGKAMNRAVRLIDQLNNSLDMERGQKIAENLRALYVYMLARLTWPTSPTMHASSMRSLR
jgi:flagellar biosynthetic protein FliS